MRKDDQLNIFQRLGYVLVICVGTVAYAVFGIFMLIWEKIKKLFKLNEK